MNIDCFVVDSSSLRPYLHYFDLCGILSVIPRQ